MKDMQIFNYKNNEVRTFEIEGQPWWVLKDVCAALDLNSPHKVAERLDEDERNLIPVTDSLGRKQETTVINESGLYNVIFRSDKDKAREFKRWVTHEVLPAIRKTGTYSVEGYKTKRTSAGEVASLLKILRGVMKDQKSPPEDIAEMTDMICDQFGISLPDKFVVENLNPQLMMVFIQ